MCVEASALHLRIQRLHHPPHLWGEVSPALLGNVVWQAVQGFGHAAGNACYRHLVIQQRDTNQRCRQDSRQTALFLAFCTDKSRHLMQAHVHEQASWVTRVACSMVSNFEVETWLING